MKILITGGAGYAGSHFCRLLRAENIEHLVYDDLSTGHEEMLEGSPFVEGSVADAATLDKVFAQMRPDVVVHMAAMATLSGCAAEPEKCESTNVQGTDNVLAAMEKYGVKYIVHASSCAVYAPLTELVPLSEATSAIGPASLYGQSKWKNEQQIIAEKRIKHVMTRMFNIAGADPVGGIGERHDPETHLVPLAIEAALGQRPGLAIYGIDYPTADGTAVRDYIHVCDIATAFLQGVRHLVGGGDSLIVNLGSGVGTSVRELLAAVERHVGKPVPVSITVRREGDTPYLVCDGTHAREALGWQPQISDIDTIVATALKWHRGY